MHRALLGAILFLHYGCGICAAFTAPVRFTATRKVIVDNPIPSSTPTSPTGVRSQLQRIMDRLDTVQSAGIKNARTQGVSLKSVLTTAKKLWNPKTYLALMLVTALRWQWCFNNIFYWLAVAFGVKWYRARYVFKIPVMDRQPNWNNVITSKEQEKDLKAFTCKTCGSTLFVAKSREFLFEGKTGIGGLGCFNCGARGNDNFVSDRDRIVEDVGDLDDYFDYERPLDFVSAAERRKLLKETGGDEEMANQLLMERSGQGESQPANAASDVSEAAPVVDVGGDAEETAVPPKAKPSPPKKVAKEDDDDDILDLLDMD